MFQNYKATRNDLKAVEEGIKTVWKKELDFVFTNKKVLKRTAIISFDSQFIYLWTKQKFSELKQKTTSLPNYRLYQIPHRPPIADVDHSVWYASIPKKEFYRFLPRLFTIKSNFVFPRIMGGLLTPFIKIHQKMSKSGEYPFDPYTTKESFLATILHEFAHVYWNQSKLWWYSNKRKNLQYLKTAKQLYEKKTKALELFLELPVPEGIGEIFATCTEWWASEIFWPSHKKNIDVFAKKRIKILINQENRKDLEQEDSVLEPSKNPHDFAFVFGKIILTYYPKTWPIVLTKPSLIAKP